MRYLWLLLLAACSTPSQQDRMSDASAIAFATGPAFADIVEHLPPEAWGGVDLKMYWYDRTRQIVVDGDHYLSIGSSADGANALEARKANLANAQFLAQLLAESLSKP